MAHRYRYRKVHGWLAALLFVAGLLLSAQKAGLIGNAGQATARNQPGVRADEIQIAMPKVKTISATASARCGPSLTSGEMAE